MKQTVEENTNGLYERSPLSNITEVVWNEVQVRDYSCFYEIGTASQTDLWEESDDESEFIRSFGEIHQ